MSGERNTRREILDRLELSGQCASTTFGLEMWQDERPFICER